MKSDKGNKVVIMSKPDYDNKTIKSIEEDNFKVAKKSPLTSIFFEFQSCT